MATEQTFEVKIQPTFFIGQGKKIQFRLKVIYNGEDNQLKFNECSFRLRAGIGDKAEDLVPSENEAKKVRIIRSEPKFKISEPLKSNQQVVWEVSSDAEDPFTYETPLTLTFSDIELNTEAGTAELTFEAVIGNKTEQYPLRLTKATNPTFDVKIQPDGVFFVGQEKKNQLCLTITYSGGPKSLHFKDCLFRLRAGIGGQTEDLVLSENVAEEIGATSSESEFTVTRSFESKLTCVWEIFSLGESQFTRETPLTITFSNIQSNTKAGTAELTFEAIIGEKTERYPLLDLTKETDEPGIIYFYSTTEARVKSLGGNSIYPAAERILPREKVTFHWQVHKLDQLALNAWGTSASGITLTEEDLRQGKKEVANITEDTDFIFSGVVRPGKEIRAKVEVKVLKGQSWHNLKNIKDEELEPTCIFIGDVDNSTVYAVFRRNRGKQEAGLLFKTENPFWGWRLMPGKVPDGFATSPGVCHQNKLWLIGGSQIDPEITSNEIWRTNIPSPGEREKLEWEKLAQTTPWAPRMGHAVLVYKNDIWVLGGCDENGNALKDCWKFDVSESTWSPLADMPGSPRCMISAVPVEKNIKQWEIWLCGGVKEVFSDEFSRDLYIYRSEGKWEGPILPKTSPLQALGLQVFNDRLHLICQTTQPSIETLFYKLNAPSKPDEWSKLSNGLLQDWAEDLTVVYQLVNFKNKLLVAKALRYKKANYSLKVYVP